MLAALAALCAASSASVGPDGSTQPQCDCEGLQAIIKHVSDRYAALETECTENVVKAMVGCPLPSDPAPVPSVCNVVTCCAPLPASPIRTWSQRRKIAVPT